MPGAVFASIFRWNAAKLEGGLVAEKIFTLASEIVELRSKWRTLSVYGKFEQTVISVLTLVIAAIVSIATWHLILQTLKLVPAKLSGRSC
jgi:hypothetical protein